VMLVLDLSLLLELTIRAHDLLVSDIRKAMDEIASYHDKD